jgi:WD40 repeat protein
VWEAASGQPITPPLKHDAAVLHAAFSADGDLFATASADRTARVWDASTGAPLSPPLYHEDVVRHVAFDSSRRRLVTTTAGGVVRLWALDRRPPPLAHDAVQTSAFARGGRHLLTASLGEVKVWDLTGGPALTWAVPAQIYDAVFSGDGRRVAAGSGDGAARIWDVTTGAEVRTLEHGRRVYSVSFHPDGQRVATAAAIAPESAVIVWDIATGRALFTLAHPEPGPDRVEFSSDGSALLTSGRGAATVWNVVTRQPIDGLQFEDDVRSASFSTDGTRVAVVAGAGARVYDVAR